MKIIYGIIFLGIIVFIHEAGHFIAALICKVKVESFSIGMGPVLLHKKIKGIDWRLSLFPLGGYCGMKGENQVLDGDSPEKYDSDSLYGVSPLKRGIIAFAGPFFNLFLTYFCFVVISLIGYNYYSASSKITIATDIYPEISSSAYESGLRTGDVVKSIDGKEISDFTDLQEIVSTNADKNLIFVVDRNGELKEFDVKIILDKSNGSGKIGVVSDSSTVEKRQTKTYGFFESLVHGAVKTYNIFIDSIKGIITLFKGVDITNAVSGPASITTMLGSTIENSFSLDLKTGLSSILQFVALISISLFLMNLLPIPVLDGGLILVSLIEGIFKIRVSTKVRNRIQYIGILFIAFLFVIAIIGDFKFFLRMFNEK